MLVVIATDFAPLLEHAVSSLIVWGGRQILCLRYSVDGSAPRLDVHLPGAWTRIGQLGIPTQALRTITVAIANEPGDEDPIEALTVQAFARVTCEAERFGSHGFALLWQRRREGWALTIGVVDPWAMLARSIDRGFLGSANNAITRWFAANRSKQRSGPASLSMIAKLAAELLEPFVEVTVEDEASWLDVWHAIRDGGRVGLADFWGVPGDSHARRRGAQL